MFCPFDLFACGTNLVPFWEEAFHFWMFWIWNPFKTPGTEWIPSSRGGQEFGMPNFRQVGESSFKDIIPKMVRNSMWQGWKSTHKWLWPTNKFRFLEKCHSILVNYGNLHDQLCLNSQLSKFSEFSWMCKCEPRLPWRPLKLQVEYVLCCTSCEDGQLIPIPCSEIWEKTETMIHRIAT